MNETTHLLTDLALARQALEDTTKEEELMCRLYPKIFQIAIFVAGSHHHADDITQVAALEVLKSLKNYKGVGSLEAWAGRITYRTAVRSLKHAKRIEKEHAPLNDEDFVSADTPERKLVRRRTFENAVNKLSIIPEIRRTPLLLHLAFGYTVSEVSEIMGVSKNTTKDRLKTAFRELRTILENNPSLLVILQEEMK
jgi:RNA polymerase sigma-70 factor, ECF subfamily